MLVRYWIFVSFLLILGASNGCATSAMWKEASNDGLPLRSFVGFVVNSKTPAVPQALAISYGSKDRVVLIPCDRFGRPTGPFRGMASPPQEVWLSETAAISNVHFTAQDFEQGRQAVRDGRITATNPADQLQWSTGAILGGGSASMLVVEVQPIRPSIDKRRLVGNWAARASFYVCMPASKQKSQAEAQGDDTRAALLTPPMLLCDAVMDPLEYFLWAFVIGDKPLPWEK